MSVYESIVSPATGVPSMPSVLAQTGISLTNTHGAVLIGTFCGVILYGISLHQCYHYARSFSSDALVIKLLVVLVMLLETVHVAVTIHSCYYYLVSHYFDPLALLHGVWSLNLLPMLSGTLMFISQLFFAYRVFLMGPGQRIVVVIALLLLVGEVALSIAATAKALLISGYEQTKNVTYLGAGGLGLAVIGDALLTLALILAFHRSRNADRSQTVRPRDSFIQPMSLDAVKGSLDNPEQLRAVGPQIEERQETVADFLQIYLINTGLLAGAFNLAAFIAALARPADLIYVSINIITTRLYGNSLLAVLNSRKASLAGMEIFVDSSSPVNIADAERAQSRMNWNVPVTWKEPPQIRVDVATERETDGPSRAQDPGHDGALLMRLRGTLRRASRGARA